MRDVRVETCGGNGLTLEGTCANAGTCIGLDVSFNGGWGISDNSEVGNTFIGCHADQNNLGAYQTTLISTRSIFLGCYVEAPGNPGAKFESHVQPPSIMFGGFASDSQRGAGSTMYCDTDGKLLLKQGAVGLLRAASGAVASAWIGGPQAEALNALGFAASDGSPNDAHPYYLQYNRATGWWDLTYDGSPPPLRLGTHTSDGTAEGGKQIWFPNGFYVGGGAAHGGYPVKIGTDVHHPTDPGEQHEIRFYSYPGPAAVLLPGHPVGWVCTEVGTWRPFGAILPGV